MKAATWIPTAAPAAVRFEGGSPTAEGTILVSHFSGWWKDAAYTGVLPGKALASVNPCSQMEKSKKQNKFNVSTSSTVFWCRAHLAPSHAFLPASPHS